MKKLNYSQVNELVNRVKTHTPSKLKMNVFRAIKEFLLNHKDEIYLYNGLYFISDKWVYNPDTPQEIEPLPNKALFCGWHDSNDDTYHYWLKDKKIMLKYGISYADYKAFNSLNWFITADKKLYINNQYFELQAE